MSGFYRAADKGAEIFELVNGRAPGFMDDGFVPLQTFDNVKPGTSVVVALEDPINFGSDLRTIALIFDDAQVLTRAPQEEGTVKSYPIDKIMGQRLTVWVDKAVDARVNVLSRDDAIKAVENSDLTVLDELGKSIDEQAEKQRKTVNRTLIGVGVIVTVLIVAAAYALPKVKLPSIKAG